jgi:hypothetical protein
MGNCGDGLHLNRVHFLERMVQDSGSVDGLEAQVLVIKVSDEQTLGRKRIRLNVNICSSDALQKARFANIGIAADQKRPRVRVDRGKTTKMLSNLLKIQQRIFQSLADCGHATERRSLELLALEQ